MVDRDPGGKIARRVLAGIVGDDDDLGDPFGRDLARDGGRRERTVERLAAGHRDRIVVEDLVGDVDLRGDRGAQREAAAVVVRAVAEVREDVLLVGERRLADPRHAFAAHVRERRCLAVHPDRHHVTADAGRGAAAFGDVGRRIVRAARAEVGNALERDLGSGERGLLGVDPVDARVELLRGTRAEVEPSDPLRDHPCDHRRRELRQRGQQPVAVRAHPFALLVELADHVGPHVVAPVVELLLELVLDDLPLFLDDEDLFQPFRELPDPLGLERPRHRDLVDAEADLRGIGVGDAEIGERLPHVEVALAAGDDPEPRLGRIDDDPVELVHAAVVQRGVDLVVLHPRLGGEERVGPADREAVRRQRKIVRDDDRRAVRTDVHGRRGLDGVGDAFEAHPATGIARHRPAVQAEVENLLHRRRVEHGHHRRGELVVRLVRQRGRLRAVVVAGQHQHAAMLRRAGVIGVLEHVAATVHAGSLAVPHPEHAVVFRARIQVDLLGSPQRRRREILVQPGLERDVRALQELLRLPQRLVEGAQR